MPRKAIIAIEDFFGVQEFMASFVGREGAAKRPIKNMPANITEEKRKNF